MSPRPPLAHRPPGRLVLLRALLGKELLRLRRNPAALMAVGLLLLMSVLVSLEARQSQAAQRAEARAAGQPCAVLHAPGDAFAAYLARHRPPMPLRYVETPQPLGVHHPHGLPCAVEIGALDEGPQAEDKPRRRLVFRHGEDRARTERLARWVLGGLAAQALDGVVEQSMQPFPPDHAPARPPALGKLDLGTGSSRALVGTMLLYSTLFFVCGALFISFSAHERERGIAQALALSPAGPGLALAAKLIFHLGLAALACAAMLAVLAPRLLGLPVAWAVLLMAGLGQLAVGALVVSFTRSQTSASLVGFCYLMGVGAVMALSGRFPAFQVLRGLMFEHHALAALHALLDPQRGSAITLVHGGLGLVTTVPVGLGLAAWAWVRRGWRQP